MNFGIVNFTFEQMLNFLLFLILLFQNRTSTFEVHVTVLKSVIDRIGRCETSIFSNESIDIINRLLVLKIGLLFHTGNELALGMVQGFFENRENALNILIFGDSVTERGLGHENGLVIGGKYIFNGGAVF